MSGLPAPGRTIAPGPRWGGATDRRRLAIGSVWAALTNAAGLTAGLLSTSILVRAMKVDDYGTLAVGTAVATLLAGIAGLGLGPSVARFGVLGAAGAEPAATARAAAVVGLRIAVGAAGLAVLASAAAAGAMHMSGGLAAAGTVVLVLTPLVAVAPFQAVATGYFTATFRPRLASLQQSTMSLTQLGLVAAAVAIGLTAAYEVAVTRVLSALLGLTLVAALLHARGDLRHTTASRPTQRAVIGLGASMMLTALAGILIAQLDVFVLGLAHGAKAAGNYAPLARLADIAIGFPVTVGAYLISPLTVAAATADKVAIHRLYQWASLWAVVAAAPLVSVLIVTPADVVHVLFGDHLTSFTAPLRILGVGLAMNFAFGFNGIALDAFGEARTVALRSGVGIALSVVACSILIPVWGAIGAALSTVSAVLGINVFCSLALNRRHGVHPWHGAVAGAISASVTGGLGAAILVHVADLGGWAAIVTAAVLAPGAALVVPLTHRLRAHRHG